MPTSPVMVLLTHHIPLTLLLDLDAAFDPPGGTGPDSVAINGAERPADDPVWLEAAARATARRRLLSA